MSYESDMRQLQQSAERQGWRCSRTTRGHYQFYAPNREDIITFAGTPGDVRGYNNSLAQMKKAGFVDVNGNTTPSATLGDMFPKQNDTSEPEPQPSDKPRPSLVVLIRDYMLNHRGKQVTIDDLAAHCIALRVGTTQNHVGITMAGLVKKHEFRRIRMGVYIMDTPESAPRVEVPPPAPTPAPPPPTLAQPDDSKIDDDIVELDAALAALGRIETVVRRNRAVMQQFKELKAALDKLGLKV